MKTSLISLVACALVVGILGSGAPEPPSSFRPGPLVVDWPTADGFEGNHYSPLADITPETVEHLEVAWTYRTGDWGTHEDGRAGMSFESTPLMVDGTLYVMTPASRAIALDAETGDELWVFDAGIDRSDRNHGMVTSRGLSYWRDDRARPGAPCAARIVFASFDARLFSVDAETGEACIQFGIDGRVDLGRGVDRIEGRRSMFKNTAPPAIVGDRVVVGSTIFDSHHADAPSGKVRAFDARTGALLWAWEPIVSAGGAEGTELAVGAANTWATMTPDPELGLVFVPTSSPSPDHYGGLRPGDNRYANSLVALDAESGTVVWHFQMVHHDLWDYDLPSPPVLLTLERDGRKVPAVVQTTKMGFVFVFDRRTGEPLFEIEERPVPVSDVPGEVTSPTQPFPVKPAPLVPLGLEPDDAWGLTPSDRAACAARIRSHRHDGVFAPPSTKGTVAFPGFVGGMEWGGLGFDPERGLMITNTNRVAMVSTLIPRDVADTMPEPGEGAKFSLAQQESTPFAVIREPLLSPLGIPCSPPPWGMIHAVDLNTGELVWEHPLGTIQDITKVPAPGAWGSPNFGGPLVTGGLVFIGASMDRRIRALDLATGETVWSDRLPASVQSTPMTYRVRRGAPQMVVVTAGGHDGIRSSLGDWVVAYALPTAPGDDR